MKKTLIILLMFVLAVSLFAEDAKVLPKGVIRAYVVPSYIFGSEMFDGNGDKVANAIQDIPTGDYAFFNFGAAVEYGLTDWVTVAAQWAPGSNLYSDFADYAQAAGEGAFELFTGAKLQFIGEKGLSQSDTIRFAVAPGIMIPMAFSYDPEAEADNFAATMTYFLSSGFAGALTDFNAAPAVGAFGLGARIYADYIVNEMFFINIYGEFIKFLTKDAADDFVASAQNALLGAGIVDVDYGFQLTTEVEFNFTKPLAEGLSMSAGLPVGFEYSPEVKYDDTDPDPASDDTSYTLSVNPNASLFVTSLPLPLEFKVSYWYPLMGQNAMARNVITAQIKAYMKF